MAALATTDVGEAAPRMTHPSERRNHIVVDVGGSSSDGSIIDLTSTGTVRISVSGEEE